MSILSDLDPKNARFLDHPSSGRRSKATWFLALMPLLGAVWIFFSFQSAKNAAGEQGVVAAPAIKEDHGIADRPAALSGANSAELPALAKSASSVPERATEGAAQILAAAHPQNYGQSERTADANVFQAMQRELDQPANNVSSQAADRQAIKATKPKNTQGKVKSAASVKKAGQASTARRAPLNSGNPAERDIDIITAIVR